LIDKVSQNKKLEMELFSGVSTTHVAKEKGKKWVDLIKAGKSACFHQWGGQVFHFCNTQWFWVFEKN
jgi:hypothetical protein